MCNSTTIMGSWHCMCVDMQVHVRVCPLLCWCAWEATASMRAQHVRLCAHAGGNLGMKKLVRYCAHHGACTGPSWDSKEAHMTPARPRAARPPARTHAHPLSPHLSFFLARTCTELSPLITHHCTHAHLCKTTHQFTPAVVECLEGIRAELLGIIMLVQAWRITMLSGNGRWTQ